MRFTKQNGKKDAPIKAIRFRLLLPLAIITLLLIGLSSAALLITQQRNQQQLNQHLINDANSSLKLSLKRKSSMISSITAALLNNPQLPIAMQEQDREQLLSLTSSVFQNLRDKYSITHLYFHRPDLTNLVRIHKPDKFGDTIERFTALTAKQTGKTTWGVELGPLGTFTLRVVQPVYAENNIIGFIEMGQEVEEILNLINKRLGVELLVTFHKQYLERKQWESGIKMLGRNSKWDRYKTEILSYSTISSHHSELDPYIHGEKKYTHRKFTNQIHFANKSWRMANLPLKDVAGTEVGELIILHDITASKAAFTRLATITTGLALILFACLSSLYNLVLRRTDRRIYNQQKTLHEKTIEWEKTFHAIPDIVLILDKNFHIIQINQAGLDALQLKQGEYIDETCHYLFHNTKEPCTGCPCVLSLQDNHQHTAIIEHPSLGKTFHLSTAPVLDQNNNIQKIVYIARDITKLKQIEKQLSMFKTFAETSNQGMGWTDEQGLIQYANHALAEILGEKDHKMPLGKNVAMEYYAEEEQHRLNKEIFPVVLKNGSWSGELILRQTNGDLIATYNNLFLIQNKKSDPIFFANIVTDITKQKIAQVEKDNMASQLYRAKKMESIGLMAGGVAHDLNNILSGIIGYPQLMLRKLPQDSDLRKPLEAIAESGQRAATVVADLLTVARGAASIREYWNLNILIQEYLSSPECEQLQSFYPDVTYQEQLTANQAGIECSPVHVKKCIMNLLTNAAEAIVGRGTITISTSNRHIDEKTHIQQKIKVGEYVVCSIEDTGPGISKLDREHIFEPFYSKKIMGRSGTGLGLTVVWNSMEDHDGKIVVESSEKGTVFHLYFPVSTLSNAPSNDLKHDEIPTGKGEHILIVDDEPLLRDISCEIMKSFNYHVDAVDSGEAAIKFVKEKPVDLILLDMFMEPGINGRQTYEEIVKLYPGQKALIVSGFSESNDIKATMQLGASGFIKKPYSMAKLAQAARNALDSSSVSGH